jgi:hypothetical protein
MFSDKGGVTDFADVGLYMNVAPVVHLPQKVKLGADHDQLPFFITKIEVGGEKTIKRVSR